MINEKLIIVGKMLKNEYGINGPSGVINALISEFNKKKIEYEVVFYDPTEVNSIKFVFRLISKILCSSNCIINVHTDGFLIPFIILILSKLNKKNKYFLTVHGIYKIESKFSGRKTSLFVKILEIIVEKYFPNLICVSSKLKKDIIRIFKREKNIFVINNGVCIKNAIYENKKCNNIIKFILTGGIRTRKGVFETLELIKYLNDSINNYTFKLEIYGPIDSDVILEKFNKYIKMNNLQKYITYFGTIIDKNLLYTKYSEADINLCLSHFDTFNISVLESMVVGTPSIVSLDCGASDLIQNGVDGFVTNMNYNYKKEIKNIILYNCCNEKKLNEIRKNAFDNVRKFSWTNVCDEYIKLFSNN